jgi:hypothetical protein
MAKKKTSKIDNAIAELDEIKKKQVLTEIRSIKIQYTIAILSLLGSAVAFIVVQRNSISELTQRDPRLSVVCEDVFVKRSARIRIIGNNNKETYLESDIKNLDDEIKLTAGSYTTSIVLNDREIWNESFILQLNQTRLVKLPEFFHNRISLYVKNPEPETKPGEKINLEINASGNGYLWIYELLEGGEVRLLFPSPKEAELDAHQISASQPFDFPENGYLAAGKTERQEKYIFLITSLNELDFSRQIVNGIYGKDIDKGEIQSIEKNWGITSIDVTVKR